MTSFYQHDVGRLFDDASENRSSMLDLVSPIPMRIRHLIEALESAAELDPSATESPPRDEQAGDRDALVRYRDRLESLLEVLHPVAPTFVPLPDAAEVMAFSRAVADVLREWGEWRERFKDDDVSFHLANALQNSERRWQGALEELARGSASSAELQELETQLKENRRKQQAIRSRQPHLEQAAIAFIGSVIPDAEGERRGCDLPTLLESLDVGLTRWIESARAGFGPRPQELYRELAAVRRDALAVFKTELRAWTQTVERDRHDLRTLESKEAELEQRLQTRTPETDVLSRFREAMDAARRVPIAEWRRLFERERWQAGAARRELRSRVLEELRQEIKSCRERLRSSPEERNETLRQLADAMNEVSQRFSISGQPTVEVRAREVSIPGDGPIESAEQDRKDRKRTARVSLRAKLGYKDGRERQVLSSGQQSQLAVAYMVAQNLLVAQAEPPLDKGMPHRVLLLDDVSSTYDLTNLIRESILWRQLAYTKDKKLKRQIFLASHHEDLSNLHIDNLVPPSDYTMRVLRFTNWTQEDGPDIDPWTVEPARAHDDQDAKTAFQRGIGALFNGG
jgi:hypothetical protein